MYSIPIIDAHIMQLLEDKDYYFLNMLSVVCTDADLALALIRIFNTSNHSLFLINCLLRKEIARHQGSEGMNSPVIDACLQLQLVFPQHVVHLRLILFTGDPNTLFRSDSPATRIIREYFHLVSIISQLRIVVI